MEGKFLSDCDRFKASRLNVKYNKVNIIKG